MENNEDHLVPKPRPIQIIRPDDSHNFKLENWFKVNRIFQSDKLTHHELVVVSIAGDYRKGKSFLLNYFLKYLNARYKKHDFEDWISKEDDDVVDGFSCRGGKKRETIGIWMWSEIFTHEFEDGKKVAIVLLDTQGIFDNESDMKECISIFAMSMLLSSVQCYNVKNQVQENDLTNLQLFTEYARFALNDVNEKPFQQLLFIVRDWPSPFDHDFGFSNDYVKDILGRTEQQTTEMHELRDAISKSFDKIDAFLFPYPGNDVAQHRKSTPGETKKLRIEPEFLNCVEDLAEKLLAPEKLISKKIGGKTLQAAEFLEYLGNYIRVFSGTKLPKPISILQATAEAYLKACYDECMDDYLNEMDNQLENTDVYCEENDLSEKHANAMEKAIARFRNRPKLGGLQLQSSYMETLQKDIQNGYRTIHDANETERVNVQSKQKKIFVSIAGGIAVAGAVGSVLVAGPLGLGLFASYAAASNSMLSGLIFGGAAGGGIGGAGIGAGIKKVLPRKWLGTETALSKTMKQLKDSRKHKFGMESIPSASDSPVSSSSDIQMTHMNTDAMSNSAEQEPLNNTATVSGRIESMQNSTARSASNIETNTTTAYEFTTPADRILVAEFIRTYSSTNHFYVPKMIFRNIKDTILRSRPRSN